MDLRQFLKKKARAHKFLGQLSHDEINQIVDQHVPVLKSIQIFNLQIPGAPEVLDEYYEMTERIISDVKDELIREYRSKLPRVLKGTFLEKGIINYLKF